MKPGTGRGWGPSPQQASSAASPAAPGRGRRSQCQWVQEACGLPRWVQGGVRAEPSKPLQMTPGKNAESWWPVRKGKGPLWAAAARGRGWGQREGVAWAPTLLSPSETVRASEKASLRSPEPPPTTYPLPKTHLSSPGLGRSLFPCPLVTVRPAGRSARGRQGQPSVCSRHSHPPRGRSVGSLGLGPGSRGAQESQHLSTGGQGEADVREIEARMSPKSPHFQPADDAGRSVLSSEVRGNGRERERDRESEHARASMRALHS